MAEKRSGPGGRIHSEGSNPTLKRAVIANMGVPTRAVRDINVNEAGNFFITRACHNDQENTKNVRHYQLDDNHND